MERLCQTGAAELLLPFAAFMPQLAQLGISLETVVSLADLFNASIETTVRRVVEVSSEPLVMLMVRPKVDPPLTGAYIGANDCVHDPRAELVVAYASAGEACSAIRIATGTKLPPRSSAERAWKRVSLAGKSVVIERAVEDWADIGELGICFCEAMTLPKASTTPSEIVCLMRLGESPVQSPIGRMS